MNGRRIKKRVQRYRDVVPDVSESLDGGWGQGQRTVERTDITVYACYC